MSRKHSYSVSTISYIHWLLPLKERPACVVSGPFALSTSVRFSSHSVSQTTSLHVITSTVGSESRGEEGGEEGKGRGRERKKRERDWGEEEKERNQPTCVGM